jgi:DNA-binding PadR family transcriptional regulator
MNEQIKKLVKKTYLFDDYETVADRQQKIYSFTEEGLEKFAKLIVAECVAVIEPGEFMQGTAHNDTKKIIALNQRKIKRHFGVEE